MTSVVAEGHGLLVSWIPGTASESVGSYAVMVSASKSGVTPAVRCAGPFHITVDGSNSAGLVQGLCTGVAYVAQVSAANSTGRSAYSPASNPVVPLPAQAPDAPVVTSVFGRAGALLVAWSPPANDGGEAIIGYRVTAAAGSAKVTSSIGASATSATISDLVDGTDYRVSVLAANGVGPSSAATGSGIPTTAYVPRRPAEVTATPDGTGAMVVSWTHPVDDGGNRITGYIVTWRQVVPRSDGSYVPAPGTSPHTDTVGSSTTTLTISAGSFKPAAALYTVAVAAINAIGPGPATDTLTPVAPVTTVSAKTIVLSAATLAALGSDAPASPGPGRVLYWPAPAPSQVTHLEVGKVIVGAPAPAAPSGLLDVVASVKADGNGNYTVTTTPASVNSVFSSLALATTSNPLTVAGSTSSGSVRDAARFRPAMAGVRNLTEGTNATMTFSPSLDLSVDLSTGENGGFVSGEVDLQPNLSLSIGIDHGLAGVPDGVNLTAEASVTVADSLRAEIDGSYEHQLGEITSPPIDIQVGLVPVVIQPDIPIFVTVSGQVGVSFSASATIGASMSWDSLNSTVLNVDNLSKAGLTGGHPGLSVTGEIDTELSVQPSIRLYDLAGPYIEGDLHAVADINLTPPPGGAYLTITPELQLKAGLELDILDGAYQASLDVTLATVTFPSFSIIAAPSAVLNITPANAQVLPGQTVHFSAARSDGQNGHPVSWSLGQAAGDTITSSGLFTASVPPGRTVTVYATDDTGAVGQTTVTVGTPFDPVGNLTATQDTTDTGARVSWTAPSETGGSPIANYLLTSSNGVPSQSTAATNASLADLSPGTTYTVTVYPINTEGQTGPPAATSLYVVPLCTDTFTGAGNGASWDQAANWSTDRVPDSADWVCTSGSSVTLPPKSVTIQGLQQDDGTITIPVGTTLTVTNTASIRDFATIAGPGMLVLPAGSTTSLTTCPTLSGLRVLNKGTLSSDLSDSCGYSGVAPGLKNGAVLENAGTFRLADGTSFGVGDQNKADRLINDAGATIRYEGGTGGPARVEAPVTDKGTIELGAGTVDLTGGGVLEGSPNVVGPGVLGLAGGTFSFPSTVTFSGAPTLEVDDGELSITSGLALTGVQSFNVTNFATIAGPGMLVLPAGSTTSLTTCPTLSGLRVLNKGTLSSDLSDSCGYSGVAPGLKNGAVLENAGTFRLADGTSFGVGDQNKADRLINDAGATIRYEGGTGGPARVEAPVTDKGTIELGAGTVDLTGGGVLEGSPNVVGPGVLGLAGGTFSFPSTVTFSGAPTLEVDDGELSITSGLALTGVQSFNVTNFATIAGPGMLVLPAGSTTSLTTCPTLSGLRVLNKGTLSSDLSDSCGYSGVAPGLKNGAVLENAGTFRLADGTSFGVGDENKADRLINDAGATIRYEGGTGGPARVEAPVTDKGTIELGAGTVDLTGTLAIQSASANLPPAGTKVTVLTGRRVAGRFSNVTGTQLSGEHWAVSYSSTSVTLTATSDSG